MSTFSIHNFIQSMQFPFITHGIVLYKRQYADNTLTLRKCMCMRASGASELLGIFTFLNCYFFQYFVGTSDTVGTNDMLVGLHVPTNFPMYQQISKCTDKSPKRHYGGGGAIAAPAPPPLATLMTPASPAPPAPRVDNTAHYNLR